MVFGDVDVEWFFRFGFVEFFFDDFGFLKEEKLCLSMFFEERYG